MSSWSIASPISFISCCNVIPWLPSWGAVAAHTFSTREYRTRLIADVVTGKLDVREAAARLPDEVEEPEPFDKTGALIDGEEEASDGFDNTSEEAVV